MAAKGSHRSCSSTATGLFGKKDILEFVEGKKSDRIFHNAVLAKKIVCTICMSHDSSKPKFVLPGEGMQHFRTMHRQRYDKCYDLSGEKMIKKLHGDETKELLISMSSYRTKKNDKGYTKYRVTYLDKDNPLPLAIDLVSESTRECAKLFGVLLDHYGYLQGLTGKPCEVMISFDNQTAVQKFSIWKSKNEIYTQCSTPKPGMQLLTATPTPLMEVETTRTASKRVPSGETNAINVLQKIFGYSEFRPGQEAAINNILEGNDAVVIIPTGGGKTVVYAIAGVMCPGITVVISPIIMLMFDQVARLRECGINACYYNTLLSETEKEFILHNLALKNCQYEFVFTSPEAVLTKPFTDCLKIMSSNGQLSRFIIDEAHCVELWGKEFRLEYGQLGKLRSFGKQIICLTGTATVHTISVITNTIGMKEYSLVKLPCRRENLKFEVRNKEEHHSYEQIIDIITNCFVGNPGIVYCATQDEASQLAFALQQSNISATYYHAGTDGDDKLRNSTLFLEGRVDVIAATIAFGMGIDKKNVRFVIHHSMPSGFEDYIQMSGRGGRDGEPATSIVLFRFMDRLFHLRNIGKLQDHQHQAAMLNGLNCITKYLTDKRTCRQQAIAEYFGEDQGETCNTCDNCQRTVQQEQEDLTEDAQSIIQCLQSLSYVKERVLSKDLCLTYIGSKAKEVIDQKFDSCVNYGGGKKQFKTMKTLSKFIEHLIIQGFIEEKIKKGGELKQPTVYIVPGATESLFNHQVSVYFQR